jgi:hypothetical protein
MLSTFIILAIVIICVSIVNGIDIGSITRAARNMGAVFVASALCSFPHVLQPASANDALDAATRAMLTTKEKTTTAERAFDSLPDAAKRRRALQLCKDSDARRAAGYESSFDCTNSVFEGNFKIASNVAVPSDFGVYDLNSLRNI